jgi:hypothetical protein
MRAKLRRLTVANLMIAVAAFALSIKLGLAYSRSPRYWEEAKFYEQAGESARFLARLLEQEDKPRQGPSLAVPPSTSGIAAKGVTTLEYEPAYELHGDERRDAAIKSRKFAERLDRMRAKYRRAAFLPWLPNAPDVP